MALVKYFTLLTIILTVHQYKVDSSRMIGPLDILTNKMKLRVTNNTVISLREAIQRKEILERALAVSSSSAWPGTFCCIYEDCNFDKTVMICERNTCKCPTNYDFGGGGIKVDMLWNNDEGRCQSKLGSACDVKVRGPEKMNGKRIDCIPGAICEQLSGLPQGMGHCVERVEENKLL